MIYVLQVQTGKENYVCSWLNKNQIAAYVPKRSLFIRKSGLWTKQVNILFPSYVFVDIEYSANLHHIIKAAYGVIRFLGKPTPLSSHEADMILWLANNGNTIEPSIAYVDKNGDIIKFDGFLNGCEDKINHLNIRQKKACVTVKIDDKIHKVNLGFDFSDKNTNYN